MLPFREDDLKQVDLSPDITDYTRVCIVVED